jgi:hypothetical protein
MFLISLLLIGLIAIAIVTEQKSSVVEQEELIPIPVRTDKNR